MKKKIFSNTLKAARNMTVEDLRKKRSKYLRQKRTPLNRICVYVINLELLSR